MSGAQDVHAANDVLESDGDRTDYPTGGPDQLKHPVLTARWLETAHTAARSAFEREMRRERRTLDEEFDRFWREQTGREA